MGRKKKAESKPSIFDDIDNVAEDTAFQYTPESIVTLITDEGKLPHDWCPYGEDYRVKLPKFIGDEPPSERVEGKAIEWEVINDGDPDLTPVYFTMPKPPKDLSKIDGYGKHKDEQYFRRFEIPKKLRILEKKALEKLFEIEKRNRQDTIQGYKYYLKYWELFESEEENLQEEIIWLKKVWWHRKNGYWFMLEGVPTFLPPDYFDFLNFYFIDEASCYPEYRHDVRRKFCFAWYLENCTETFAHIDPETGRATKGMDGKYEMVDLGRRLFFGDCEPKTRRTGATHEAVHKILKESITRKSYFSTIISFEGNNAQIHYEKKLLPAFDNIPMCIKPIWEGNRRPTTLKLNAPPNVYHIKGLGSAVSYSDSGGLFKNEGDRLNGLLNDEQGKCLGINELVIMADGEIKAVQDIVDGDYVMGDDGTPRLVSNCTKGMGDLYRVSSKFGDFVCNGNHILSLKSCQHTLKGSKHIGDVINVPIKDILTWHPQSIRNTKLYRAPIKYEQQEVPIEPYFLGLWLGNGDHSEPRITNIDKEIIDYIKEFANRNNWGYSTWGIVHSITFNGKHGGLRKILRDIDLYKNKHIPDVYLKNDRETRLQLLAGIIDTDGSRDTREKSMVYDIVQKRKELAEQICQLANSLEFWSRVENKVATMKRKDGTVYKCSVYRVKIYGDLYKIPVRVERKKYPIPTWWRNKNPNSSWFKIEYIGKGEYYGFELDGNHLFMLKNQIVTHNSSALKIDIFERWRINKFTMSTGMGINILDGVYVKNPSTIEQMESSAAPYFKLCMESDFYKRMPYKGQTVSGFARIFLPAYLRMEGFIDRFGKSVVENPTERQIVLTDEAIFAKSKKGAKQIFQAERDALIAENTAQSLETYRSIRRKSPFTWAECWLGTSGSVGYNLEIVDKRLGELNRLKAIGKSPYKVGYFERENNDPNGRVLWKTDIEKDKFKMSMDLPEAMTNQREMIELWDGLSMKWIRSWRPINGSKFTCGVDPFRNLRANEAKMSSKMGTNFSGSRQSDGGIAILWEYDDSIDRGKPKDEWDSYKFVLTYRYRPATQEDYFEDVIMAIQYYGAMCYPEQNVEAFIAYMFKRGYGGYFMYDIGLDGKQKPLPGRYTTTETQQDMIREYKDYINFRGHLENHDDLLGEIKAFRGLEDFTTKDLKTAGGMALLGSKSRYREIIDGQSNQSFDLGNIFTKRRY